MGVVEVAKPRENTAKQNFAMSRTMILHPNTHATPSTAKIWYWMQTPRYGYFCAFVSWLSMAKSEYPEHQTWSLPRSSREHLQNQT